MIRAGDECKLEFHLRLLFVGKATKPSTSDEDDGMVNTETTMFAQAAVAKTPRRT